MKIATWNVERLKVHRKLPSILSCCTNVNADILVLTETDKQIKPRYTYCFSTLPLHHCTSSFYKKTENRVSIFTNYKAVGEHPTYDAHTAICVELETEYGNLLVYGTIMGIYGNRHMYYKSDVKHQLEDIERLSKLGIPICICGDFNCSFADNYYYTKWARNNILQVLEGHNIKLMTRDIVECIDHIAISANLLQDKSYQTEEWNHNKTLSDHKGIAIIIN